MLVVDSGASMHMLSKKDLNSDEMDTLREVQTPATVLIANGKVQTNEEAQVHVQDLDLFVTVQLFEETPAVLSLGKLCSEHRCSYEWENGETHDWPKMGRQLLVSWITLYLSSSSSASTSRPKDQSNSFGESEISSDRTTTTRFALLNETLPEGYMWSGLRLTKIQPTSRPDHFWAWRLDKNWKAPQRREKQVWAIE